ncbi:MAG TPA: succinate dehydrogenase assembly factor 2 [Gammaproteobacteria bacterium]|nr:succinate dehydrogenase assembly factor 2 [Gammaproteobacteria bacterium]
MTKPLHPGQLRWQCRRGLLELDVLLGNFLERKYPAISSHQQTAFAALLESTDQELINWLLIRDSLPADSSLQEIVFMLRAGV